MDSLLLLETRKEYIGYLVRLLTPIIYKTFDDIYASVKNASDVNDSNILVSFQLALRLIQNWNAAKLNTIITEITHAIGDDFDLSDLVHALMKAQISICAGTINHNINPNVNMNEFIHNVYLACARVFYKYPILFYDMGPMLEIQGNKKKIEDEIEKKINETISMSIPLGSTIRYFLNGAKKRKVEDIAITEEDNARVGTLLKQQSTRNDIKYSLRSVKEKSAQKTKQELEQQLVQGHQSLQGAEPLAPRGRQGHQSLQGAEPLAPRGRQGGRQAALPPPESETSNANVLVEHYTTKKGKEYATDGLKMLNDAELTEKNAEPPMTGSYVVPGARATKTILFDE